MKSNDNQKVVYQPIHRNNDYQTDEELLAMNKKNLKKNILFFTLSITSIFLMAASYMISLVGGNDNEIVSLAPIIIIFGVLSPIFAILAIFFIIKCELFSNRKIMNIVRAFIVVLMVSICGFMFIWDTGISFESHGTLNAIFFVSCIILFVSFAGIFYACCFECCCCCLPKERQHLFRNLYKQPLFLIFWAMLLGTITATIVISGTLPKEKLYYGLYEARMSEDNHCIISEPYIHWLDILPQKYMTFWSSDQCDIKKKFARVEDGYLVIDCPSDLNPTYILSPNFMKDIPDGTEFLEWQNGVLIQDNAIKDRYKYIVKTDNRSDIEVPYIEPVPFGVNEYALAKCDQDYNMVVYSFRNETRVKQVKEQNKNKKENPHDILVLFIDALSRRNFYRAFPQAADVLTKYTSNDTNTNGHFLAQFFRYHVQGCCTYPNVVPLYSGVHSNNQTKTKDLVWKDLHEAGYVTGWTSGMCYDLWGKYFNSTGYVLDHEIVAPFCHPEYYDYKDPYGVLTGAYSIIRRCIGAQKVHQYNFNYIKDFWHSYKDVPKAAGMNFIEAHEYSNSVIHLVDDDLAIFLEQYFTDEAFNRTVLTIVSDHGNYYGPLALPVDEGTLFEHRLPLLMHIAPPSYNQLHRQKIQNLAANEQMLFTSTEVNANIRSFANIEIKHSVALTDVVLNKNRTCSEAGIESQYCACNTKHLDFVR